MVPRVHMSPHPKRHAGWFSWFNWPSCLEFSKSDTTAAIHMVTHILFLSISTEVIPFHNALGHVTALPNAYTN